MKGKHDHIITTLKNYIKNIFRYKVYNKILKTICNS